MAEPTYAEMEALTSLFINLGFGSAVVASLIWFLMYLVKVSLPQQQEAFLQALREERAQRNADTDRLVKRIGGLVHAVRRHQSLLMDHIDVSFKQLVAEVQAARDRHRGDPTDRPA